MEGADEALKELGVRLHSIINVMQITQSLHEQKFIDDDILEKVRRQIGE
jgi:orotate phosphoribosyltransferase